MSARWKAMSRSDSGTSRTRSIRWKTGYITIESALGEERRPVRVVIAGLGIQGRKRLAIANSDVVVTVDPLDGEARYRDIVQVPVDEYDAALVCTPDEAKLPILRYLLGHGKHVLVEKPLVAEDSSALEAIARLATTTGAVCYTAYNHRFEPHFVRMKETI